MCLHKPPKLPLVVANKTNVSLSYLLIAQKNRKNEWARNRKKDAVGIGDIMNVTNIYTAKIKYSSFFINNTHTEKAKMSRACAGMFWPLEAKNLAIASVIKHVTYSIHKVAKHDHSPNSDSSPSSLPYRSIESPSKPSV